MNRQLNRIVKRRSNRCLESSSEQQGHTMPKPVVYIASPYTKGDPCMNTHFQLCVFDRLMTDGIVWPVVPLWSHFQHTLFPRHYRDWIDYDLALLSRYEACVRLNAELPEHDYCVTESSGADGEVKAFKEAGKPVFYSIEDCYEWADVISSIRKG